MKTSSFLSLPCLLGLVASASALETIDDYPAAILADFSTTGTATEEGWTEMSVENASLKVIDITTTALGTELGISALLVDDGETWESRDGVVGGNRIPVTGTSADQVIDGMVVTRDGGATLELEGLAVDQEYRLLFSSNDTHRPSINPGFANGGGSISLAINNGATAGASEEGMITNNSGETEEPPDSVHSDADFTLASLSFTATDSSVSIDLTSTNPNGFMPLTGMVLQVVMPDLENFRVTEIVRQPNGAVDLTWNSLPDEGTSYSVLFDADLALPLESWKIAASDVPTQGVSTSTTVLAEDLPADALSLFFRVQLNEAGGE